MNDCVLSILDWFRTYVIIAPDAHSVYQGSLRTSQVWNYVWPVIRKACFMCGFNKTKPKRSILRSQFRGKKTTFCRRIQNIRLVFRRLDTATAPLTFMFSFQMNLRTSDVFGDQ